MSPKHLLAWEEASFLRALLLAGMRQVQVAALFGVSQSYISLQSKAPPSGPRTPEEQRVIELRAELDALQQRMTERVREAIPAEWVKR